MQLTKSKLALTLSLATLGSSCFSSETPADRWVAKDPYEGRKYEKEQVSTFAMGTNYVMTITSGIGMTGYAGYQIYKDWETTSFTIPYIAEIIPDLTQTIPGVPTLKTAMNFTLTIAALLGLGIPSNMILTYGAKKAAMLLEIIGHYGLDAFKFGFNSAAYRINHIRAEYLQGTLWQNNRVTYVEPKAAE